MFTILVAVGCSVMSMHHDRPGKFTERRVQLEAKQDELVAVALRETSREGS